MNHLFRNTLLATLMLVAIPAQAAILTYGFNGTLDSGYYDNETFSGLLSFDDAAITGSGTEWVGVNFLNLNLLGGVYGIADADVAPEVGFENGTFLGLSASFSSGDPAFSLIAGTIDASDAYLAYDTTQGLSGAGTAVYAQVPEPETYALMLAGLVGLLASRRKC